MQKLTFRQLYHAGEHNYLICPESNHLVATIFNEYWFFGNRSLPSRQEFSACFGKKASHFAAVLQTFYCSDERCKYRQLVQQRNASQSALREYNCFLMPNSHRPPDTTRQSCLCRVWRCELRLETVWQSLSDKSPSSRGV